MSFFVQFSLHSLVQNDETYADICKRLEDASPGATILVQNTEGMNGIANGGGGSPRRTYPLSTLKIIDASQLPLDVDPTNKEVRNKQNILFFIL